MELEHREAITRTGLIELDPYVPGSPIQDRLPLDKDVPDSIAEGINARLDAYKDTRSPYYDDRLQGDPRQLSGCLIEGMREYAMAGDIPKAIATLDVGLGWSRSRVSGECYKEVALSAIDHYKTSGDVAMVDIAYAIALDETRLTSGAGRPRTLEAMVHAGRSSGKIAEYSITWLSRASAVYGAAKQTGAESTKEVELKEKIELFVTTLEHQVQDQKLPVRKVSYMDRHVKYPYSEELTACLVNLRAAGSKEWEKRLKDLLKNAHNSELEGREQPKHTDTALERADRLRTLISRMTGRNGVGLYSTRRNDSDRTHRTRV